MKKLAVVLVLVALAALLVGGCTPKSDPWEPEIGRDPIETYRIAPGDVLRIEGGKNPELSRDEARIDEEGFVNLLFLGKVKAAGKTKSELERDIADAYKEGGHFTDPQVSVTVLTLFYFVDGQVRQRGRKMYVRQITLFQAIIDAGGFTEYGNRAKVRVLRPQPGKKPLVFVINCKPIMTGAAADNFVVRPNDTIYVPRGY